MRRFELWTTAAGLHRGNTSKLPAVGRQRLVYSWTALLDSARAAGFHNKCSCEQITAPVALAGAAAPAHPLPRSDERDHVAGLSSVYNALLGKHTPPTAVSPPSCSKASSSQHMATSSHRHHRSQSVSSAALANRQWFKQLVSDPSSLLSSLPVGAARTVARLWPSGNGHYTRLYGSVGLGEDGAPAADTSRSSPSTPSSASVAKGRYVTYSGTQCQQAAKLLTAAIARCQSVDALQGVRSHP